MLVSAILPTKGRVNFARQALRCFLSQTYVHRELIVLDDATEPSFPKGGPDIDGVFYLRHTTPMTIAQKRNRCCQMASGDVICHFDSDDWSSPHRIDDQVAVLKECGKAVVGYHSMFFYQEDPPLAYYYRGYELQPIGTSLMYTKAWWKAHPFRDGKPHANVGEDTAFGKEARDHDEIYTVEAPGSMVARIHAGNTSVKHIDCATVEYHKVAMDLIPRGFFT